MEKFEKSITLGMIGTEVSRRLVSITKREYNQRNGISVGMPESLIKIALYSTWTKYYQWYKDLYINEMQLWIVDSFLRIIAKTYDFEFPSMKELRKQLPFIHSYKQATNKGTKSEYISLMNSLAAHSLEPFITEKKKDTRKKKIYKCFNLACANQMYELMQKRYPVNMITTAEISIEENKGKSAEALQFPYRVIVRFNNIETGE